MSGIFLKIHGVNWCKNKTQLNDAHFSSLFFKPTKCHLKPTENGKTARVYYWGTGILLGFLNSKEYEKYLNFAKSALTIECKIEPKHSLNLLTVDFAVIYVFEPIKKSNKINSKANDFDKIEPITPPKSGREKHPITKKAFAYKKNLVAYCDRLKGFSGIYCIYDKEFRTYIGQSKNIGKRFKTHIRDLNNGNHHNELMQMVWNSKVPEEKNLTFELIEELPQEELDAREAAYIKRFQTFVYGFNRTTDGQGYFIQDEEPNLTKQIDVGEKSELSFDENTYNRHQQSLNVDHTLENEPDHFTEEHWGILIEHYQKENLLFSEADQNQDGINRHVEYDLIDNPVLCILSSLDNQCTIKDSKIRTLNIHSTDAIEKLIDKATSISLTFKFKLGNLVYKFSKIKIATIITYDLQLIQLSSKINAAKSFMSDKDIEKYNYKLEQLKKLIS